MLCCRNVIFCTESESADRPEDEIHRSTGQEEHRDQQGLRTFRAEIVRHPNYGKANDVINDQYTGCPKDSFFYRDTVLKINYIFSPDFIYLSTTLAPLWTRYPLVLSISVATHCQFLPAILNSVFA